MGKNICLQRSDPLGSMLGVLPPWFMVRMELPRRLLECKCLRIAVTGLCISLSGFYGVYAIADQVSC